MGRPSGPGSNGGTRGDTISCSNLNGGRDRALISTSSSALTCRSIAAAFSFYSSLLRFKMLLLASLFARSFASRACSFANCSASRRCAARLGSHWERLLLRVTTTTLPGVYTQQLLHDDIWKHRSIKP